MSDDEVQAAFDRYLQHSGFIDENGMNHNAVRAAYCAFRAAYAELSAEIELLNAQLEEAIRLGGRREYERDCLQDENAALRKDAERYRYCRAEVLKDNPDVSEQEADARLDAEIAKVKS
jgi:hypothetical protein